MIRQPQTAVLLAAGRGKRLRPHTDTTPKPLLPVNGRPTLDYVLTAIARANISQVCLVTHYLEEQIVDYVADGSRWGLATRFVHQPEMLGTGHALQMAINAYPDWFERPFLMTATDYIFTSDHVSDLVTFHREHTADISISLKKMSFEALSGRSSVRYRDDFNIEEVVEKPEPGQAPSPYAASLLFVFPAEIGSYLQRSAPSARGEVEVQTAMNQMLMSGYTGRGLSQPIPAEWEGVYGARVL